MSWRGTMTLSAQATAYCVVEGPSIYLVEWPLLFVVKYIQRRTQRVASTPAKSEASDKQWTPGLELRSPPCRLMAQQTTTLLTHNQAPAAFQRPQASIPLFHPQPRFMPGPPYHLPSRLGSDLVPPTNCRASRGTSSDPLYPGGECRIGESA